MKQIEYTQEQEMVIKVVNEVFEEVEKSQRLYDYEKRTIFGIKQKIYDKYGIKEKYQTLREYLKQHSCGAYHHFIFDLSNGDLHVNVIGIEEFERLYNKSLLDKYYVLNDLTSSNGGNCENYQGVHRLELVLKEE